MSHAGSHMGLDLPPYDRHALVHTWAFQPGWLLAGLVLLGGYLYLARRAATNGRPLPGWRIGCWVFGVVLLGECLFAPNWLGVALIAAGGALVAYRG